MCGMTFNPNVNVALWRVGRDRQRSEMESQCVRKSQGKCCLCVFGRKREREKVRKKTTERGRASGRASERETDRQAARVFVLHRD